MQVPGRRTKVTLARGAFVPGERQYALRFLTQLLWRALFQTVLLLVSLGSAQAASYEYWVDDAPSSSLTQAQDKAQWRPYDGLLTLGFTTSTLWVRVKPDRDLSPEPLVLRVRPSYLDSVEFFWPNRFGVYQTSGQGDRHAFVNRAFADTSFNVRWDEPSMAYPVYIRITSTSALITQVSLLNYREFETRKDLEILTSGVFFGLMIFILIWSFWVWQRYRDRNFLNFGLYAFFSFFMIIFLLGYPAKYSLFSSQSLSHVTGMLVLLATLMGIYFHKSFVFDIVSINVKSPSLELIFYLALLNFAYFFLDNYTALRNNSWLVPSGVLLVLWELYRSRSSGSGKKKKILTIYFYTMVFLFLSMLPLLGQGLIGEISLYLISFHGLATAVVVSFLLNYYLDDLRKKVAFAQEKISELELTNKLVNQEKAEKDNFLAMLSHEIRTLLSVIRISMGFLDHSQTKVNNKNVNRVKHAIDEMYGILEKVIQANQFSELGNRSEVVKIDLLYFSNELLAEYGWDILVSQSASVDEAFVMCDPVLLRIILVNLLENAVKYSEPQRPIDLVIGIDADSLLSLSISNYYRSETLPEPSRIFEKYYRGPAAHRKAGSGLGLHLVKQICSISGIDIDYKISGSERISFELCFRP